MYFLEGQVLVCAHQDAAGGALHHLDDSVVDRVLVLLKPPSDVVGHDTGVVGDGEVGVLIRLRLRLQEHRQLAKRRLQLLLEGLVGGLGEEGLLLEDGPDAHGLLEHDDGGCQVHAEVHHHPVDPFLDVFFLFHNKPDVLKTVRYLFSESITLTCDG